jgi:hypothetical protein
VSLDVRFEEEASDELEQAARWYQRRRSGLGLEVLDAINVCVRRIQQWPEAAAAIQGLHLATVRRAPVAQFPYSLVYLQTDTGIRILAVAHAARRPFYWVDRLAR